MFETSVFGSEWEPLVHGNAWADEVEVTEHALVGLATTLLTSPDPSNVFVPTSQSSCERAYGTPLASWLVR